MSCSRPAGRENQEEVENPTSRKLFIVTGDSHATRLAEALKERGETVISLASPELRLTEDSVAHLSAPLLEATAQAVDCTVVFVLLYMTTIPIMPARDRVREPSQEEMKMAFIMSKGD